MKVEETYNITLTKTEFSKINDLLSIINSQNIAPLVKGTLTTYSAEQLAEIACLLHENMRKCY